MTFFLYGLREYPKGLGKALLKILKENQAHLKPEPCLRQKYDLTEHVSEIELFKSMKLNDTWPDANLCDVYLYLWKNKNLNVPLLWRDTMRAFTAELISATRQHMGS